MMEDEKCNDGNGRFSEGDLVRIVNERSINNGSVGCLGWRKPNGLWTVRTVDSICWAYEDHLELLESRLQESLR